MEETFDLRSLQNRINKIKEEGKEAVDFTLEYIQCLLERHDLASAISPEFSIDEIPDSIFDSIRRDQLPEREQIILLEPDLQNFLLFELIWVCGMFAISYYSSVLDPDNENEVLESILKMSEISPGHSTACYIIAALTIVMSRIPGHDMISKMTNDFSDDPEQIESNLNYFTEISAGILLRYKEDILYYKR